MNYYELLGVSSNASSEEIKIAYKKQMKKWHPDINKDSEAISMSMKINEAKDVLLDEIKRKEYDELLKYKEDKVYEKYVNKKTSSYNYNEPYMITKWEYFKEYLKSDNVSFLKKVLSVLFVFLESLLCFTLKWFVIILAFICFSLGDIISMIFSYAFPIIGILVLFLIYQFVSTSNNDLNVNRFSQLSFLIAIVFIYFSSYVFIILGKKLISQKVFNFLYNKLDIYLFKKAVFYR